MGTSATGPPSLLALALDTVCARLDDFGDALGCLPVDSKRLVLEQAVAKGMVTDETVVHLVDDGMRSVSLRRCSAIRDVETVAVLAARCPSLVHLDLSDCKQVTDAAVASIARACPALRSLHLGRCWRVGDAGIEQVAACCPDLAVLDLECAAVTSRGAAALARCSNLQCLSLADCDMVEDDGIVALLRGCTALRHLNLCSVWQFTDAALDAIGEHAGHSLASLSLAWCRQRTLTQAALERLFRRCLVLEQVDLCGVVAVDNAVLDAIAATTPRLASLRLTWCLRVTDSAVCALVDALAATLVDLDMGSCEQVTDLTLAHVARAAPQLRTANVAGCGRVTAEAVAHLEAALPTLCIDSNFSRPRLFNAPQMRMAEFMAEACVQPR